MLLLFSHEAGQKQQDWWDSDRQGNLNKRILICSSWGVEIGTNWRWKVIGTAIDADEILKGSRLDDMY